MPRRLVLALAAVTLFAAYAARPAMACPNCSRAVSASGQDGDHQADPVKGYFWSIVLMLGMPFALLATVGGAFYRMYRKNAAAPPASAPPTEPSAAPPELPQPDAGPDSATLE